MRANIKSNRSGSLAVVGDWIGKAADARKCHGCGCLHATVEALSRTEAGQSELAPVLERARSVSVPKKYDCLGCSVCYPALAANAFADAFPEDGQTLELCPTDEPAERRGWPPLPGDYHVTRYRAPVALCTLNSEGLALRIARAAPAGLAIAGTLHTENLGIERIIRNVLANPHVRFLVLCGRDTQQAIGHLPGDSLASLFAHGIDGSGRIRGAHGKRPVLKNVMREQVETFVRQVELVSLIGEERDARVLARIRACVDRDPGPFDGAPEDVRVELIRAREPGRTIPDPAGYLVVYPDAARRLLIVEHYTKAGLLDCVIEGTTPAELYPTVIERGLITRLDHAAYLGRELERARHAMDTGARYVQDGAPGPNEPSCGCTRGGNQ